MADDTKIMDQVPIQKLDVMTEFPDLSIVKKEVLAFEHEECQTTRKMVVPISMQILNNSEMIIPKTEKNTALDLDAETFAPTQSSSKQKINEIIYSPSIGEELNIGDVDISCLNEEIDLGTDIKIPGLGSSLPVPESPTKVVRRPKDRDRSKKVHSVAKSVIDMTESVKPMNRDTSKKACSALIKRAVNVGRNNESNSQDVDAIRYKPKLLSDDVFDTEVFEDNDIIEDVGESELAETPFFGNRIIIGSNKSNSKSNKRTNNCNENFTSLNNKAEDKIVKHNDTTKKRVEVENPRECRICKVVFSTVGNLNKHIKNKHVFLHQYEKMFNNKDKKVDKSKAKIESQKTFKCATVKKNQIQNKVVKDKITVMSTFETDLDKIRKEVIKEAQTRLGIVNDSDESDVDSNNETYEDYVDEDIPEYKCSKCDEELDSQAEFAKHELEHVNLKARNAKDCIVVVENLNLKQIRIIIDTLSSTGEKSETEPNELIDYSHDSFDRATTVKETNRPVKRKVKSNVISKTAINLLPKSVLFKCNNCNLNFVTTLAATVHKRKCVGVGRFWKCTKCGNNIAVPDREAHEKQHLYSDTFHVYNVGQRIPKKSLLSKCPECACYFREFTFASHYLVCGREPPNVTYCSHCDVLVEASYMKSHRHAHTSMRTEDFIIIEYGIISDSEDKQISDETPTKKPKHTDVEENGGRMQFLYCHYCKSFINNVTGNDTAAHFENRCQNLAMTMCNECGLTFPNSSMSLHKQKHEDDFSIVNVLFYDLWFKQIDPPLPPFPRCPVCMLFFLDSDKVLQHTCHKTQFTKCHFCHMNFAASCYKIHNSFHSYIDYKDKAPFGRQKIEQLQTMLLAKHNHLLTIYQCVDCNVVLSDEKVASHQKLKCEKTKGLNKKCFQCKFMFNREDYNEHVERHEDKTFQRNKIRIVPFDCRSDIVEAKRNAEKLTAEEILCEDRQTNFTEQTSDICEEMGKKESDSCEREDREISDSQSVDCKINQIDTVAENNIVTSVKETDANVECQAESLDEIQNGTSFIENKAKSKDEIQNEPSIDVENDNTAEDDCLLVDDGLINKNDAIIDKVDAWKRVTVYKCTCGLHFMTEIDIFDHFFDCSTSQFSESSSIGQKCPKCSLLFNPSTLFNHLVKQHAKNRKFACNIVEISSKCSDRDVIYKCSKCSAHFLTESFADAHIKSCSSSEEATLCKICGLKFDDKMAKYHQKRHHSKKNFGADDFDIITINDIVEVTDKDNVPNDFVTDRTEHFEVAEETIEEIEKTTVTKKYSDNLNDPENSERNVYKCPKCDLHFLTKQGARKHLSKPGCFPTTFAKICDKCNLKFAYCDRHVEIHHDLYNLKGEDLLVSEYRPKKTIKKKTPNEHNVLFRCSECELYFATKDGLYRHVVIKKHETGPSKRCEICKIHFGMPTLRFHMHGHYEQGLKFEDYVIRTYPLTDIEKDDDKYSDIVYKCAKCSVCSLKRIEMLLHKAEKNKYQCPPRRIEKCHVCDLEFTTHTFYEHVRYHHDVRNLSFNDLTIVDSDTVIGRSLSKSLMRNQMNKIYKCKSCSLHFPSKKTCVTHMENHQPILKSHRVRCRKCGIVFHNQVMDLHLKRHHTEHNFTAKDMVVHEYDNANWNEGTNLSIKTYTALKSFTRPEGGDGVSDTDVDMDVEKDKTNNDMKVKLLNEGETANMDIEEVIDRAYDKNQEGPIDDQLRPDNMDVEKDKVHDDNKVELSNEGESSNKDIEKDIDKANGNMDMAKVIDKVNDVNQMGPLDDELRSVNMDIEIDKVHDNNKVELSNEGESSKMDIEKDIDKANGDIDIEKDIDKANGDMDIEKDINKANGDMDIEKDVEKANDRNQLGP